MWPVPLGPAHGGQLEHTLKQAGPEEFAPIGECPGCVRHDYAMTLALFQRSLPGLALHGLKLAADRRLTGAKGAPEPV